MIQSRDKTDNIKWQINENNDVDVHMNLEKYNTEYS